MGTKQWNRLSYLQHVQWDAATNDGAHECNHQSHEVHGELELQELPDAVEHAATPQHSPANVQHTMLEFEGFNVMHGVVAAEHTAISSVCLASATSSNQATAARQSQAACCTTSLNMHV